MVKLDGLGLLMFVQIGAIGPLEMRNDVFSCACFTVHDFCEDIVESRLAVLDMRVDASRTFGLKSCPSILEVVEVRSI